MKRNQNNLMHAVFFLLDNSSKRKLKHDFINSFYLNYRRDSVNLNETHSVLVPRLW